MPFPRSTIKYIRDIAICEQHMATSILGDPGAVSGGGEKSSGREKHSGEEKSRRRIRAPGDKVLTDQFQTVGAILASDWCQKIFVFFLPNHRAGTLGVASCSPTRNIHTRQLLAICCEGLLEEKSSKHSTKCRGNPQESRRIYAEHFAGIVILASLCTH